MNFSTAARTNRREATVEIRDRPALLLAWYDRHRRRLPWRALPGERADAYRVWLSEIMLQQTRVVAVIEHYARFMEKFPTLPALAAANEDAVLACWSGLGYYRRARALHAAAREVVERYGGDLPRDAAALRSISGIGPYTAGAIASLAFGAALVFLLLVGVLLWSAREPVQPGQITA